MRRELHFDPLPLFSDPHKQTIGGAVLNFQREPISVCKLIQLPDGDKIAMEVTTPVDWNPSNLTVIMVHGLCGSHSSPYLVRLVGRLAPLGVRCIRFNMRGCGSGKGLARGIEHGGRSEDLFEALKVLKRESPESPIFLIGFSFGANLSLKLAGELNQIGSNYLTGVVAISPPVDLYVSTRMIERPSNRVYEQCFTKLLKEQLDYIYRTFQDMPRIQLPKNFKIYEFHQSYVAPMCGFKDAMDYYNKCSSVHLIEDITVPCRILLSEDDPIVCHSSLDHCNLPLNVDLFKTKKGGHMGYLGNPKGKYGFRWLDSLIVEWFCEMNGIDDSRIAI